MELMAEKIREREDTAVKITKMNHREGEKWFFLNECIYSNPWENAEHWVLNVIIKTLEGAGTENIFKEMIMDKIILHLMKTITTDWKNWVNSKKDQHRENNTKTHHKQIAEKQW